MKKNLLALALSVLVVGGALAPAVAQDAAKPRQEARVKKHKGERRTPEERAKARTERLDKELDLSRAQAKKVEALYLKAAKEREAKKTSYERENRKARKQMRAEMMAAHQRHNEEMKDILNKRQYAKYEELQAQKREQMRARHQEKGTRGQHERGRTQSR